MEALRELVAQARASTGQPREALPPGFDDDAEIDAVPSPPTQAQRGEKRKAEAELEELVSASAGIEEVKLPRKRVGIQRRRRCFRKRFLPSLVLSLDDPRPIPLRQRHQQQRPRQRQSSKKRAKQVMTAIPTPTLTLLVATLQMMKVTRTEMLAVQVWR